MKVLEMQKSNPLIPLKVIANLAVMLIAIAIGGVAVSNLRLVLLFVIGATSAVLFVITHGSPWLFVGLLQGGISLLVFFVQELGIVHIPPGMTLPTVAALAVLGMAFNLMVSPAAKKSLFSPMSFRVFVFSALVVLGVFYSWHGLAGQKAMLYLVANLTSFMVALTLNRRQRRYLYTFFVFFALFITIGVIVSFLSSGLGAVRGRYGAFGMESLAVAQMIGLGLITVLYMRYKCKRIYIIVLVMGVLLSGARGSAVGVLVAILIQPLFEGKGFTNLWQFFSLRRFLMLGIILGLGIALLWLTIRIYQPGILAQNWGPFRMIAETNLSDRNIISRIDHWSIALKDARLSPLIGMGTSGYSGSSAWRNPLSLSYPHNLFLEVLSEWGILGLVLFFLMLLRCAANIKWLSRFAQHTQGNWWRSETWVIAGIFIFALTRSSFNSQIYNNRTLWLALGLSESLYREVKLYLSCKSNVQ